MRIRHVGAISILRMTLRDQIARARRAAPALARDAELALNSFEIHACTGMADDFAVGNPAAYTNNHGCKALCWLVMG